MQLLEKSNFLFHKADFSWKGKQIYLPLYEQL